MSKAIQTLIAEDIYYGLTFSQEQYKTIYDELTAVYSLPKQTQ